MKLEGTLDNFKTVSNEMIRRTKKTEELQEKYKQTKGEYLSSQQEIERKKEAIKALQVHNREVTEKYSNMIQEQSDEICSLKGQLQGLEELREQYSALGIKCEKAEEELAKRVMLQEHCDSLLKVIEEQQQMIMELKGKQENLQTDIAGFAAVEAEWKERARTWAREKNALEKELRDVKYNLKKALMS